MFRKIINNVLVKTLEFAKDVKFVYSYNFNWTTAHDNGKTVYEENTLTGERRYWQRSGGYQPVNSAWLNYETNEI